MARIRGVGGEREIERDDDGGKDGVVVHGVFPMMNSGHGKQSTASDGSRVCENTQ